MWFSQVPLVMKQAGGYALMDLLYPSSLRLVYRRGLKHLAGRFMCHIKSGQSLRRLQLKP